MKNPMPQLSICISVKNRSCVVHEGREVRLLPNCIDSLAFATRQMESVELIIADFNSDDWPLKDWIKEQVGNLQIRVLEIDTPFSRGRGLNAAVAVATSKRIFLCDADILVNDANILHRGIELIDQGKAWFPVCQCLDEKGDISFWHKYGYGLSFVPRDILNTVGGVPEFLSWGGEDNILYEQLLKHISVVRERPAGLLHQWHPEELRHEHYSKPVKTDFHNYLSRKLKENG